MGQFFAEYGLFLLKVSTIVAAIVVVIVVAASAGRRAHLEGLEIENRGANGTKVNGRWLEAPHSLEPGDAIFVSRYILIYQSDDVEPVDDVTILL